MFMPGEEDMKDSSEFQIKSRLHQSQALCEHSLAFLLSSSPEDRTTLLQSLTKINCTGGEKQDLDSSDLESKPEL
jgi:hypothetical protein